MAFCRGKSTVNHVAKWPDKSTTSYAMLDFESDRENFKYCKCISWICNI